MRFGNVYWDANLLQQENAFPSVLAIGDSWFWYPFPGGSLLNYLGPLIQSREHIVFALGENGAEVVDYAVGKYSKSVKTALRFHGAALSAVFISGGGNDFAGFSDLRPMLKLDCSGETTAAACFRPGDGERTLPWLTRKTLENFGLLLGEVFVWAHPEVSVFIHNYDYALPSGKGVFGPNTGSIKRALDDANVPEALQHDFVKIVIDRFTSDVLMALETTYPDRVIVVEGRKTLNPSDWANELHPKPRGFKKLAETRWYPELWARGLARLNDQVRETRVA